MEPLILLNRLNASVYPPLSVQPPRGAAKKPNSFQSLAPKIQIYPHPKRSSPIDLDTPTHLESALVYRGTLIKRGCAAAQPDYNPHTLPIFRIHPRVSCDLPHNLLASGGDITNLETYCFIGKIQIIANEAVACLKSGLDVWCLHIQETVRI